MLSKIIYALTLILILMIVGAIILQFIYSSVFSHFLFTIPFIIFCLIIILIGFQKVTNKEDKHYEKNINQ